MKLGFLLLCLAALASAQQATSSLHGTVTDPSAAALPGVAVKATNEATGVAYEGTTNTSGNYVINGIQPGRYSVSCALPSFRRMVQSGILLEVDQRARLDMVMTIGDVREVVSVTADATTVDTFSSTVKDVVDSRRVVELPLNGRQTLQLQGLLPGAVLVGATLAASAAGLSQNTTLSYSVNGSRANASAYTLDGGLNMDMYNNLAGGFPNPDAIQEFSILENNYSAAVGRDSGAVVNMVTKSGTNALHGTVYEFLRNDKLNTRNFFSQGVPPLHKNQYGGTIGGPIIKDRFFFFGSFESTRERSGLTSSNIRVPTALERVGNFSRSLLPAGRAVADPATVTAANPNGVPFPGNIVPPSSLDPVALNFAKSYLPLPNLPGDFFTYNLSLPADEDQFTGKADYAFTTNNRLMLRYFISDFRANSNDALFDFNSSKNFVNHNATVKDTQILSPRAVNTASITFNRIEFVRLPLPVRSGLPKDWNELGCISCFKIDASAPTDFALSISNGTGFKTGAPFYSYLQTWQIGDSFSLNRGNHFLIFGGEYDKIRRNGRQLFLQAGQWSFDGLRTGAAYGFADFFLGAPRSLQQYSLLRSNPDKTTPFFFAQDDWKVSQRLTLNLGLRWAPYLPIVDKFDELTAFRPGARSAFYPQAPTSLLFPSDTANGSPIPRGIVDKDWRKLEPRIGFAYDPFGNGRTSIRAGYGIFYDTLRLVGVNSISTLQPFSLGVSLFDTRLSDPYSGSFATYANQLRAYTSPPTTQAGRNGRDFVTPLGAYSIDPGFTTGYMQQWNLTFERQTVHDIVLTASYVGSKGSKFFVIQEINPAIYIPGRSTPGNIDSRRLYQPFQGISDIESPINSTYHSLQLKWNKRFAKGYSILGSYTFAKSLDTTSNDGNAGSGFGASNPFNRNNDKGHSDFDIRQRFVTSFLWELPFLRGGSTWKSRLLGGWQLNGLLTMQSGFPFSVIAGQDRSMAGGTGDRADAVAPARTFNDQSTSQKINNFIDKTAFALPALGTFGTAGRNILYGPGLANVDAAAFKDFRFLESRRLQLRWEVFNALNHSNFGNPNNNFSAGAFGRITTAGNSRIMQVGVKFIY